MEFVFKGGGEKWQGWFGELKVELSRGQRSIFCNALKGESKLTAFSSSERWVGTGCTVMKTMPRLTC